MILTLRGVLDAAAVEQLRALRVLPDPAVRLELADADAPDPITLGPLVRALEELRAAGKEVVVVAPPQMLAHTLYKAGRLRDPGLILEEPRDEEPYAG